MRPPHVPGPFIRAFAEVAPPILAANFRPDCCLNATRVVLLTMETFGVKAVPLSVRALAMNARYVERIREHGAFPDRQMLDRWVEEDGAWAVGIDTDSATEEGKWNGHLVAIAQGWMIDAAAGQFARPDRSMNVPQVFTGFASPRFMKAREAAVYQLKDRTQLSYYARLDDASVWRKYEGFQPHAVNRRVSAEIASAMRARLPSRQPPQPRLYDAKNVEVRVGGVLLKDASAEITMKPRSDT
jgi:hypothetical protein